MEGKRKEGKRQIKRWFRMVPQKPVQPIPILSAISQKTPGWWALSYGAESGLEGGSGWLVALLIWWGCSLLLKIGGNFLYCFSHVEAQRYFALFSLVTYFRISILSPPHVSDKGCEIGRHYTMSIPNDALQKVDSPLHLEAGSSTRVLPY